MNILLRSIDNRINEHSIVNECQILFWEKNGDGVKALRADPLH